MGTIYKIYVGGRQGNTSKTRQNYFLTIIQILKKWTISHDQRDYVDESSLFK